MAARQDQTLVIVNIVCILLFLLSAVFAYLGFKGKSDATQQLDSANKTLQDTQTQVRNLQSDNEDLRAKIGVDPALAREGLQTAFDEDMKKYLSGEQPFTSYRLAFANLDDRYRKAASEEAKAKEQVLDLTNKLTSLEQVKEAQIAAIEAERKKAVDGLAAAMSQFNQDRADIDAKLQQLTQTLGTQSTAFEQRIAGLNAEAEQLRMQVARQQTTITQLMERLKPATGGFEVADGNITNVSQGGNMVWINLGSADSLRPLVTFSVYDSDTNDTSKMDPKGTIEVTAVMADHQAEARITSDDPRNPILRGDKIYSPAWQRGRPLHFAFTGIVDVNDDGNSDLQLVRNLVTLNDGVVDAYLSDEGNVEGAMSVSTRYLVLGDVPQGALRIKHSDGWGNMNKEAVSLGIETITLDQFLDQMGFRPDNRSVQLGKDATARDFPTRPYNESTAEGERAMPARFRPRSPVATPSSTPTPSTNPAPGNAPSSTPAPAENSVPVAR
jgi:hypothetical protein